VTRSATSVDIAGTKAVLYEIPSTLESYFSGHVVATWKFSGATYFVSVHGWENRPRVIAMAISLVRLQQRCRGRENSRGPCRLVYRSG